jgi:hypothetical protein
MVTSFCLLSKTHTNYGKIIGHIMPLKAFLTSLTIQLVILEMYKEMHLVFMQSVCNCCPILTKILNVSTGGSEMPQHLISRKPI